MVRLGALEGLPRALLVVKPSDGHQREAKNLTDWKVEVTNLPSSKVLTKAFLECLFSSPISRDNLLGGGAIWSPFTS